METIEVDGRVEETVAITVFGKGDPNAPVLI